MPRRKDVSDAVFSFEVIAALIAASGVNISTQHYKLMAKVDPSRTASGYEHLFRAAKARAKELAEMEANGEIEAAAPKATTKRNNNTANGGATKAKAGTKRGRKARTEESPEADEDENSSKKVKTEEVDGAVEDEAQAADDDSN